MRQPKRNGPRSVSQAWLAKHLDVTPARISQFVKDGEFVSDADGKLDPDACRVRYIRWLRDETRRSSQTEQRKRLEALKARGEELRIAREENRLVEMDDVEAVFADVLGTFRSELSGLPAASTRDLAIRSEIEKHLNGAIDRCRGRFEKAGEALRAGEEVNLDGEAE